MTVKDIAHVVQEVYNQGHVKAGQQKLQYEDFEQMTYMARGDILYELYRQEEMMGLTSSISTMMRPYELPVIADKYGRKVAPFPQALNTTQLPGNAEVFSVVPIREGKTIECENIVRTVAGSQWLFCNSNDGVAYFAPYADHLEFYGLDDCVTKVLAYMMANDEKSPVSDAIAFKVAKAIWQQVFRTITLPVDKRTDGNPNYPDDVLREKLSSPQLNR